MNEQPNQPFDKERVYDEQIAPLVSQIIEICHANDMPFILSTCYGWNEDDGFQLCSTVLPAKEWQIESFEEIRKILLRKPFMMAMTITRKRASSEPTNRP